MYFCFSLVTHLCIFVSIYRNVAIDRINNVASLMGRWGNDKYRLVSGTLDTSFIANYVHECIIIIPNCIHRTFVNLLCLLIFSFKPTFIGLLSIYIMHLIIFISTCVHRTAINLYNLFNYFISYQFILFILLSTYYLLVSFISDQQCNISYGLQT